MQLGTLIKYSLSSLLAMSLAVVLLGMLGLNGSALILAAEDSVGAAVALFFLSMPLLLISVGIVTLLEQQFARLQAIKFKQPSLSLKAVVN